MTTTERPTLRVVLGLDREGIDPLLERGGEVAEELRATLEAGLPPGFESVVREQVAAALGRACDVPIETVLAEAWRKYRPLRAYCDPLRHPPDETATVELASHTVSTVQHPTVEVLIGERQAFILRFDAKLSIEVEGALLTISGGRFKSMATGRSRVGASLAYRGATLLERRVGEFPLPGRISFGEGVRICPDQRHAGVPIFRAESDAPAKAAAAGPPAGG